MGAIISYLRPGSDEYKSNSNLDIGLDLDSARPSQYEMEIYSYLSEILRPASFHLEVLSRYTGCGDFIRQAISTPNRQNEDAAWNAVSPAVLKLKEYYEFALRIEEAFPKALMFLCNGDVAKNLDSCQASAKKMADILHFASHWDELKMCNPNVQNDFSYYRRTLSRMRMGNNSQKNIVVHDELANRMSLFYANATPMTRSLIDSVSNMTTSGRITMDGLTDCLAILAAVCNNLAAKNFNVNQMLVDYSLRVMVVCVIIYDHVNHIGAFHKGSKMNIKGYAKAIQTYGGQGSTGLMNSMKYTTIHLNDETTPKNIKQLFV